MFGVEIDKDVVRRVLARRYRPSPALEVRPGSRSSDTPKIVCGALISFAASHSS